MTRHKTRIRLATLLLALAVLSTPLRVTPSTAAAAEGNTVSINGDDVTVHVRLDVVLSDDILHDDVAKNAFMGWQTKINDYWNAGLAQFQYGGCLRLHVDVQLAVISVDDFRIGLATENYARMMTTPGHHVVLMNPNPERPVVFDPYQPDAGPGVDFTSPYHYDLDGYWSDELETARDFAHETGHLLGLADDYRDVPADGGTRSESLPGRNGTLMDSGDAIDQQLANRLGDTIAKAGIKLPTCWTGTMTSSSNETVTADNVGVICSGTWTTALSLTIAGDGTVTGTAVATVDGPPTCPRGHGGTPQMEVFRSPITGTATDTELRFRLGTVSSYEPAGSGDFTALTATIYGADPSGATFTVPITAPGHAQGNQSLQYVAGVNSFTSENAIVLACQTC